MRNFKVWSDTEKEGKYVELPVLKPWTCGDGCCSDTLDDFIYFKVGDIIGLAYDQIGNQTLEIGSDYEGYGWRYYQPCYGWEDGYYSKDNLGGSAYLVEIPPCDNRRIVVKFNSRRTKK